MLDIPVWYNRKVHFLLDCIAIYCDGETWAAQDSNGEHILVHVPMNRSGDTY